MKIKLAAILGLLFAANAFAANHYVRAGAGGIASGADWTNAYTALPGTLVRGDTYFIAAGTYGAAVLNTPPSGTLVITVQRATVANHGTSTGWLNSYDGVATFTSWSIQSSYHTVDGITGDKGDAPGATTYGFQVHNDGVSVNGLMTNSGAALTNVIFSHVELDGVHCCNIDPAAGGPAGVYILSGGSNWTLSYLYIHDIKYDGILLRNTQNVTVDHCWIARNRVTAQQHSQGISQNFDASGLTVRYTVFEDVTGTAYIVMIGNPGTSSNWNIYGNLMFSNAATPPNMTNGNNGPSYMFEIIPSALLNNLNFYNNTIANTFNANDAGFYSHAGTGWVIENNLWFHTAQVVYTGDTTDYNTFLNLTCPAPGPAGACRIGTHDVHVSAGAANPFVNDADSAKDYHLKTDTTLSPGLALSAPYNTDLDGRTRGGDGTWERGAFEFGTGIPTPTCNPVISSVTVNPTSVMGGNNSTGTVTISCPPSSNTNVLLSSSNIVVAIVPATVTVLANQTTANFTVTTVGVCTSTNVTIAATLGGSTTASLVITAGGVQCQGANVIGTAKVMGTAVVQ